MYHLSFSFHGISGYIEIFVVFKEIRSLLGEEKMVVGVLGAFLSHSKV